MSKLGIVLLVLASVACGSADEPAPAPPNSTPHAVKPQVDNPGQTPMKDDAKQP